MKVIEGVFSRCMRRAFRPSFCAAICLLGVGCGRDAGGEGEGAPRTESAAAGVLSNGERIYRSAASNSGHAVTSTGPRGEDGRPLLACADCHGKRGQGATFVIDGIERTAPAIALADLTTRRQERGLPAYAEVTLSLTLRTGVTPDGRRLDPVMPRWQLSDSDMRDLVAHLLTVRDPGR